MPAPPSPLRRVLEFDLAMERSLSSPLEGRGVHARWDPDDQRLRIRTSTQTSTGVPAVANIFGLPDVAVEVITPDVGGGFGTKVVHPYPEVLVPWAAHVGTRGQVGGGPLRALRVGHPRTGPGAPRAGRVRRRRHHPRLEVEFWHDTAYTPYGIVLPIITATQLPGPYRHRHYRVVHVALHQHGDLHAVPGAGRPGRLLRHGTDDGPHRRGSLGSTVRRCGRATSSGPTSSPTTST